MSGSAGESGANDLELPDPSEFSSYQLHRFQYVPNIPKSLAQINESNVVLKEEDLPIKDELKDLFPNLLADGMKYFELQ